MPEVLDVLLSWSATTAACFYVVMRDERRLAAAAGRERPGHDGMVLALGQLAFWGGLFLDALLESPRDPIERETRAVLLVGSFAVGLISTPAAFFVGRRDAKLVAPALLERAWPWASRGAALVSLGQIAVGVHFWKTRRFGLRGLLLGIFWAVTVTLPAIAVGFVFGLIFPDSR